MKSWIYEKACKDMTKRIEDAGLSDGQIAMLTKIAERIWFCEAGIPREFFCDECKMRVKRINELWGRFQKLAKVQELQMD